MSISRLTAYTAEQYQALGITPFQIPPSRTKTGEPDNRITINLGGWVGTNLLAFTLFDSANSVSGVSIDTDAVNTILTNVVPGLNPSGITTYWTADMGTGASGTNWDFACEVSANNTNTGKWVFVKGKGTEKEKRRDDDRP
jgi:hypothetical protein